MRFLLTTVFVIVVCVFAHGQQIEPQNAQSAQNTEKNTPSAISPTVDATAIPEPLYVLLEGGLTRELSIADIEKLNITQIASIEVITDEESIRAYGEKGKNGVLIISLKPEEVTN